MYSRTYPVTTLSVTAALFLFFCTCVFAQGPPLPTGLEVLDLNDAPRTGDYVGRSVAFGDGYLFYSGTSSSGGRGDFQYTDGNTIQTLLPDQLVAPRIYGIFDGRALVHLQTVGGSSVLGAIDPLTLDTTHLMTVPAIPTGENLADRALLYVNGLGLISSDGTTGGTRLLQEISTDGFRATIGFLRPFGNDRMLCNCGDRFLVTDGTVGGTQVLLDTLILADGGLVIDDDQLYFLSGPNLYASDGTTGGTRLLSGGQFNALDGLGLTENGLVVVGTTEENGAEVYTIDELTGQAERAFTEADPNGSDDGVSDFGNGLYAPRGISVEGYYLTADAAGNLVLSRGTPATTRTYDTSVSWPDRGYLFYTLEEPVNGQYLVTVVNNYDRYLYRLDVRGSEPIFEFLVEYESRWVHFSGLHNTFSIYGDRVLFGSRPLYVFDAATGEVTAPLPNSSIDNTEPIFELDGSVYLIGSNEDLVEGLYRFNPTTGQLTEVGDFIPTDVQNISDIIGVTDGSLLVGGQTEDFRFSLFRLDQTGTASLIGPLTQAGTASSRFIEFFVGSNRLIHTEASTLYSSTGAIGTIDTLLDLAFTHPYATLRAQGPTHFLASSFASYDYYVSDGTSNYLFTENFRSGTMNAAPVADGFVTYGWPDSGEGLNFSIGFFNIADQSEITWQSGIVDRDDLPRQITPPLAVYSTEQAPDRIVVGWPENNLVELVTFDLTDGGPSNPRRLLPGVGDLSDIMNDGPLLGASFNSPDNDYHLFVHDLATGTDLLDEALPSREFLRGISNTTTVPVLVTNQRLIALDGSNTNLLDFREEENTVIHFTDAGNGRAYLSIIGDPATWVTDGTVTGTRRISFSAPISSSIFRSPVLLLDWLIFSGQQSDGSATLQFIDLTTDSTTVIDLPALQPETIELLTPYRDRLYFLANNFTYGREIHYLDFGIPPAGGVVYEDVNGNGQPDEGEPGISSVRIYLDTETEGLSGAFSQADGRYEVHPSPLSAYQLTAEPDDCWNPIPSPNGYDVAAGERPDNLNFGLTRASSTSTLRATLTSAVIRCGFTLPFWLDVVNTGCVGVDATAELDLGDLVTYVSASPEPTSSDGSVLRWNLGDLPAGASAQIALTLTLPGEDFDQQVIPMTVTAAGFDDAMELVTTDTFAYDDVLRCAIDPNDKQVHPSRPEETNSNYTQFDEELLYTVRFQNTGSDTAFNVRIEDRLSSELNWESLKPLAASHPYRMELSEAGLLKVYFDNILLVDSTTNEPLSHGFVSFTVSLAGGVEELAKIDNTAGIFFDFNRPVITNTVTSTAVEFLDRDNDGFFFYEDCDDTDPAINPDAPEVNGDGIDSNCDGADGSVATTNPLPGIIQLFPNPTAGEVTLRYNLPTELQVTVFDGRGRRMQSLRMTGRSRLNLGGYPAGLYVIRLTDGATGRTSSRRVFRQ